MSDDISIRPCPMCRSKHGAPRDAVSRGGTRYEIAKCITCHFVYVLNPQGQTFQDAQQAPSEVPERARHRQIKRVCDHQLARRPRSDGTYRIVEVVLAGRAGAGLRSR